MPEQRAAPRGPEIDQPEGVEVEVDLDVGDFEAFVRRFTKRQGTARRLRLLAGDVAVLVLAAAFVPPWLSGQRIGASHLLFVIPAVAIVWIGWRAAARMQRAAVRQFRSGDARAHTGRFRLAFDARGVTAQGPMSTVWNAWEMVSDVEETETHLFIYVGVHKAFFLPRDRCASSLPWDELVARIRAFRANARNYRMRCPRCRFDLSHAPIQGCPECGWQRDASVIETPAA